MESHAQTRAGWAAAAAAPRAGRAAAARPTRSRADPAARRPARPGCDHRRGVRGEEGAAARAHVTRGAACRLAGSVGERDAGRARCRARRVHAVLRARRRADRRRHQEPRRRRDRRARARPRRRERRGEPLAGRDRARSTPGSRCTRCRRGRSTTSAAEVRALADAARACRCPRRSAPTTGTRGWRRCSRRAGTTRSSRCGAGRGCRWRATPTARRCSTCSASNNVFADSLERYPEVTLAEVAARAPNLILLPSEPYEFGPEHAARGRAARSRACRSCSSTAATSSGGASAPPPPPPASPARCVRDPHGVWVRTHASRAGRAADRGALSGLCACGTEGSGRAAVRPISML